MHACTRSAKQKYGSIYIFLDENVFENGCIYIYIYIYIYTSIYAVIRLYIYIYIYIQLSRTLNLQHDSDYCYHCDLISAVFAAFADMSTIA